MGEGGGGLCTGMGEERTTKGKGGSGGGMPLIVVGQRLLILQGCKNVCLTEKGGTSWKWGGGECLQNNIRYLYKVQR